MVPRVKCGGVLTYLLSLFLLESAMIRRRVALKLLLLALILFFINHVLNLLSFQPPSTNVGPYNDPSLAAFGKLMHFNTIGRGYVNSNSYSTLVRKKFFLKAPDIKLKFDPRGIHPMILDPKKHVLDLARLAMYEELAHHPESVTSSIHQTLILGYWRSGTTFLGEILNEFPGTFYHYELLHELSSYQTINSTELEAQAIDFTLKLLNCGHKNLNQFTEWVDNPDLLELMRHNIRFWKMCHDDLSLCSDSDMLSNICELFPRHLMKTVRMRVRACRQLLLANTGLQIIHLVRDPRGIYNSRKDVEWCFDECTDPVVLCNEMWHDITDADKLQEEFPDRFVTLRYEDLASDPERTVKTMLEFLGHTFDEPIERFLQTHTKADGSIHISPYATKRDSNTTIFKWMKELDKTEIMDVQIKCENVIHALQYQVIPDDW